MKSGFHSQDNLNRYFQEHSGPSSNHVKTHQYTNTTLEDSNVHKSNVFYHPKEAETRKITSTIKGLGDRIEGVQAIMRRNSGRFEKIVANLKTDSHRDTEQNSFLQLSNVIKNKEPNNYKKQENEGQLRTSCPNIFKKIQTSALRNTMQSNNYSKMGNIMSEIKKFDEEGARLKKKGPSGISQSNSPVHRFHHNKYENNELTQYSFKNKIQPEPKVFQPKNDIKTVSSKYRQKNSSNFINGFLLSKQLGKGKFGEVYLAQHTQTGFVVALKKVIKSKLKQYKMVEQFKRQIRLHSALDHPNIVKFYGFFQHEDNIYLILEYISGGTLFDYLAQKDMLQSKEAAEYLRDTIEALNYMHERSIAHRDIKPENIVLTVEKVAKLCDFGWSALVESSRTTYCGTFDYAPPEILERKNYDTAVDIWCIGVLTYEILTGKVPFQGEKRKQIMQKILSVDKTKIYYPIQIPDDAKNFIELLVQKDPTQRPKCKDLLSHPFFKNNLKGPAKKL